MNAPARAPDPAGQRWTDDTGVHIDVRGLPPPQPLVAILRLVNEIGDGATAVIVHHDRDPLLLYAELAEIGWTAERIDGEPGEVRLRLLSRSGSAGLLNPPRGVDDLVVGLGAPKEPCSPPASGEAARRT